MWSGFEALFQFPFDTPGSRDEYLVAKLRSELAGLNLREEFWEGVTEWAEATYAVRCGHTHGGAPAHGQLVLEGYSLSLLYVALELAARIITARALRHAKLDFGLTAVEEELNALFVERKTILELSAALKKSDRKEIFPGTPGSEVGTLISARMSDLVTLRRVPTWFRGDTSVAKARQKLGMSLSAWAEFLLAHSPAALDIDAVRGLRDVIADGLALQEPPGAIDTKLRQYLLDTGMTTPEPYGDPTGASVRNAHGVPVWLVAEAFVRLDELFEGYPLH